MRPLLSKTNLGWLAACLLWMGAWQAASAVVGSDVLLAGPLQTLAALLRIAMSPTTPAIVWFSLSRITAGFLLAFAAGIGLGALAWRWQAVRTLLAPPVAACKSTPVACVTVLLLMWVGSRSVSGVAVFLMAFPALYLATVEALGQVDGKVSQMLAVFEVPRGRRVLAHVWPSVLPYLVATSRNACGMAWKAGVAAELIGTPLGSMGERVYQAKILLETADLFAWTVLIVALSFACERVFVGVLATTGRWSRHLALVGRKPQGSAAFSPDESLPPSLSPDEALSARLSPDEALSADPSPEGISFDGMTIGYDSAVVARDVSLDVPAGGRLVLSQASGSGKTTLLHTVAGITPPLAGQVRKPSHVAMVFQESRLIEQMSAVGNVRLASMGTLATSQARTLLEELLDADTLDRPVRELSGGQRRRVEIVRALAHPSSVVILDEPFASLDENSHQRAAAFVLAHLGGRTLLVASHHPQDATLLGMEQGPSST